jgi:hypothetical protein
MARPPKWPKIERHYSAFLLTHEDGSTDLVQTDWDYPATARDLGWNGKIGREKCGHERTDGTVDCPDCGRTASQFIQAAGEYLDSLV